MSPHSSPNIRQRERELLRQLTFLIGFYTGQPINQLMQFISILPVDTFTGPILES